MFGQNLLILKLKRFHVFSQLPILFSPPLLSSVQCWSGWVDGDMKTIGIKYWTRPKRFDRLVQDCSFICSAAPSTHSTHGWYKCINLVKLSLSLQATGNPHTIQANLINRESVWGSAHSRDEGGSSPGRSQKNQETMKGTVEILVRISKLPQARVWAYSLDSK